MKFMKVLKRKASGTFKQLKKTGKLLAHDGLQQVKRVAGKELTRAATRAADNASKVVKQHVVKVVNKHVLPTINKIGTKKKKSQAPSSSMARDYRNISVDYGDA